MSVFGAYSIYYDLLYKDKNYQGEVDFVHKLLEKNGKQGPQSVLELGCGTGKHAELFAQKKFSILGIDQSESMLSAAEERAQKYPTQLKFTKGDVRNFRTEDKFDCVFSLFHVVSYQTKNEDLFAEFQTASQHLKRGGLFVFDVWYGPAVLTDRPVNRTKKMQNEKFEVTRYATPVMDAQANTVDVNYDIEIKDLKTQQTEKIKETHKMRYLFEPELEFFLNQNSMKLIDGQEWFTGKKPSYDTWSVIFVAQKI